ncbi:unnamed protein product [Ceutorhynchus assimilis]|uniref:C2H2-type domain-containing protein n=1 Tax=Ceutorhynchus assimilis TaxID=467358 RepID=A0A9N9MVE4_9CUCU|nr:unnamed protein product [Ceutorhynchus assimilis]
MKSTAKNPKKQSRKVKETKLKVQRKNATSKKSLPKKETQKKLDNWLNKSSPQVIEAKVTRSAKNAQTQTQKQLRTNLPTSDENDENEDQNSTEKSKHRRNGSSLTYIRLSKKEYKCTKCSFIQSSSGAVKPHYDKEHGTKIYQCNLCPFQTKQQYYYSSHLKIHTRPDQKCPYCKKLIKSQCYKMHLKTHERNDESEYKCDFCNYKSYNRSNVKRHSLMIHKNRDELPTFSCDSCKYTTVLPERLNQHKKNVHSTEGIWRSCNQCDYKTRVKAHIQRHMNDVHTEKKFQCAQCSKLFSNKDNLRYHIVRRHTDANQREFFYCEMCPKEKQYKTPEKGNLIRHILTHRTLDEIEVFACHKCPYLGKSKSALKIHFVNSHMPEMHEFKCQICGYSTNTKSRFNCHMRDVHGKPKARHKKQDFANGSKEIDDSDVVIMDVDNDVIIDIS